MLKISPNWFPWIFEEKFSDNYTVGELPKDFKNIENYRKITQALLNGEEIPNATELPCGMSDKKAFILDFNGKKYVLKAQEDYLSHSKALQEAIEKEPRLKDDFFKKYNCNEDIKSDSCFTNAVIDRYLNLNNCKNATKMHFYDPQTRSVLYEFVDDEHYEGNLNILNAKDILSDINNLGIVYNDAHNGNVIVKNGVEKVIDNDDSTFVDILKPPLPIMHFTLPNWSGNSLSDFSAGLMS